MNWLLMAVGLFVMTLVGGAFTVLAGSAPAEPVETMSREMLAVVLGLILLAMIVFGVDWGDA